MHTTDFITPLEEAVLDAYDFAAGLAALAMVQEMLTKSAECRLAYRDFELPREVRAQALKESRTINTQLNVVAMARAAGGISA